MPRTAQTSTVLSIFQTISNSKFWEIKESRIFYSSMQFLGWLGVVLLFYYLLVLPVAFMHCDYHFG